MFDKVVKKFKTLIELEEFRRIVNEACDKRAEYISLCESAYNLANKNFGYIKESFENLSPELFRTSTGKKLIGKYTKTVKESNNLSSLYAIYENVRKATPDTDIDFFANTISNTDWNINNKTLNEDVKKLGMVLAEAYLYLGKDVNEKLVDGSESLYEAIEFVATNKKTPKNIAEYSGAIKLIKENISSRKTIDDGEAEFLEKKDRCVNRLKEAIELSSDDDKKRLSSVMEQLVKKSYNPETFGDDMQKLTEIEELF